MIGADRQILRGMEGLLVVTGPPKLEATRAALRGGYVDPGVLDKALTVRSPLGLRQATSRDGPGLQVCVAAFRTMAAFDEAFSPFLSQTASSMPIRTCPPSIANWATIGNACAPIRKPVQIAVLGKRFRA